MKVYISYPDAPWSGGCLIIAAENKNEALEYALKSSSLCNEVREMKNLSTSRKRGGVLEDNTYIE